MLKNNLFIANPFHLSVSNGQLLLKNKGLQKQEYQRSIEDLGCVILENRQITLSLAVLQHLANHNVAVVICDQKHHPTSLMMHLDTNYVQSQRFNLQIDASEPLKKQLWQQVVQAKIHNQNSHLELTKKYKPALKALKEKVLSGDPTNTEAQAARIYWKALMGKDFLRSRNGAFPNNLLNYGYAILRATTARALSGAGLLPTFGIHHHNKYNAYCLADDIMEPYRPFVDRTVYQLMQNRSDPPQEITKQDKYELLAGMQVDTIYQHQLSPLSLAINRTAQSLRACFEGEKRKIIYPEFVPLSI